MKALVLVLLLIPFLTTGCTTTQREPRNMLVLRDTSDSPVQPSGKPLSQMVGNWLNQAPPNSKVTVYDLAAADDPMIIQPTWSIEVPVPKPPMEMNRRKFNSVSLADLETTLDRETNRVKWSPLLEALWRAMSIAAGSEQDYELVIESDLLQTSPFLTLDQHQLDHADIQAVVRKVGEKMPAPARPPVKITILYTPGRTGTNDTFSAYRQDRLRQIFEGVARNQWKARDFAFTVVN